MTIDAYNAHCIKCGAKVPHQHVYSNTTILCAACSIEGYKQEEVQCGLDPYLTGENDPYYTGGACPDHDGDFNEMKRTGNAKVGLLGTSARWVENTSKVFIRSLWGVIGFPFYLIGGLVGGAVRWRQIFPKETIKRDRDDSETY